MSFLALAGARRTGEATRQPEKTTVAELAPVGRGALKHTSGALRKVGVHERVLQRRARLPLALEGTRPKATHEVRIHDRRVVSV